MQPKKYAIYTAMVGGYDEIMQPKVVDDRFDYILFSNDIKENRVGVWQIKPITYHNDDNTRICRYVKTHPEELLPEYDFSIWMDSNVRILTPFIYERCIELYHQGCLIASMNHLERNCIYDEAFVVQDYYLEYESVIVKWCHLLRKQKYPKNNGLFETNVVFRKKDNKIENLNLLWWMCIDAYSRRDQLSFNYVLWKHGISCEYLLPIDTNTNNSRDFERVGHTKDKTRSIDYKGNIPWLMRYINKVPQAKEEIKNVYYRIYALPFPIFWSAIFGQAYRIKYKIKIS